MRVCYQSLRPLLADANISVRVAAVEAARQLKNASLWPEIGEQLAVVKIWPHATRALAVGGDNAIPVLEAIIRRPGAGLTATKRAVGVLGRIGTPSAIRALRRYLGRPELRQLAARSLQDCHYRAEGVEAEEIHAAFRCEADELPG